FGGELLSAENSLAAIMAAHWVDHADRGAELIDDLARIAALYGLAPPPTSVVPELQEQLAAFAASFGLTNLPDSSVDAFRDRLNRYLRIFLDGPSTVRGILRVTAEALDLRINDDYAGMDTWWTRGGDGAVVSIERRGEDASMVLFGVDAKIASGRAA